MTKAQVKLHEVLNKNIQLEQQNQTLAEELMEATGDQLKGLTESSEENDPFAANSFKMPSLSPRERAQTLHVNQKFKRRESKIEKIEEDALNDSFQDFNQLYSSARNSVRQDRRQSMSTLHHQITQA